LADTVFGQIARGEAPADVIYEDELALAFRDIHPQAPVHLLVIPRRPLVSLQDAGPEDQALLGHLLLVAQRVAAEAGLRDWRLVVNNGAGAGQTVFHLHLHVLGARPLRWPPG
jgi:histidine triad (HIT) family protein